MPYTDCPGCLRLEALTLALSLRRGELERRLASTSLRLEDAERRCRELEQTLADLLRLPASGTPAGPGQARSPRAA